MKYTQEQWNQREQQFSDRHQHIFWAGVLFGVVAMLIAGELVPWWP